MTRIGSAVLGSWLCLGLASAIALSAPAPAAGAETPPGPTDPTGVEAPGSPDGGARGSRSTVPPPPHRPVRAPAGRSQGASDLRRLVFSSTDDPTFGDPNVGLAGFGGHWGLIRWLGDRPGDGLQLSISGGVFAQFNMDTPSKDLINADYVVASPSPGAAAPPRPACSSTTRLPPG